MTAEEARRRTERVIQSVATAPLDSQIKHKIEEAAGKGHTSIQLVNMNVREGFCKRQTTLLHQLGYEASWMGLNGGTMDISW